MKKIKLELSSYTDDDLSKLFSLTYDALNIVKTKEGIKDDDYEKKLEYKCYNDFYGSAFRLLIQIMNEETKRIKQKEL